MNKTERQRERESAGSKRSKWQIEARTLSLTLSSSRSVSHPIWDRKWDCLRPARVIHRPACSALLREVRQEVARRGL